jgi:hypothetical protein
MGKPDPNTAEAARRLATTAASSSTPPGPAPSSSTVEAVRRLTGETDEDLDGQIREADKRADRLRARRRRSR